MGLIVAPKPSTPRLRASPRDVLMIVRWPLAAIVVMLGLASSTPSPPTGLRPAGLGVSPGAIVATVLWLVASVAFSIYTANFGNYNETYGALGAIVVVMLWLWLGPRRHRRGRAQRRDGSARPTPAGGGDARRHLSGRGRAQVTAAGVAGRACRAPGGPRPRRGARRWSATSTSRPETIRDTAAGSRSTSGRLSSPTPSARLRRSWPITSSVPPSATAGTTRPGRPPAISRRAAAGSRHDEVEGAGRVHVVASASTNATWTPAPRRRTGPCATAAGE